MSCSLANQEMSSPPGPVECSICLGTISNRAVIDPCRHDFDYDCIKSWTNVNSNCPVCRCPVKYLHYSIVSDREYSVEKVAAINQNYDDGPSQDEFEVDSDEGEVYDSDIYGDSDGVINMDEYFGSESEYDDDDEDIDQDEEADGEVNGDEDEWEDIPSIEVSDIEDGEEQFQEAAGDSVQIIEGINSDDTIGTITVHSDSDNENDDDDDDIPATPDYGEDPGDDGQSEDEVYEDIDSDQDNLEAFDNSVEDHWQEASEGFDFDEDDDDGY